MIVINLSAFLMWLIVPGGLMCSQLVVVCVFQMCVPLATVWGYDDIKVILCKHVRVTSYMVLHSLMDGCIQRCISYKGAQYVDNDQPVDRIGSVSRSHVITK